MLLNQSKIVLIFKVVFLIMEVSKMNCMKSIRHDNNTRGVYELGL